MRQLRICSVSPSLDLFVVAVAAHSVHGRLRQVYAEIPYQSDVAFLGDWLTGTDVDTKGEQAFPEGWQVLPKELSYIQRAVFQIRDDGRVTKTMTEAGSRDEIDVESINEQVDLVVRQYEVKPTTYGVYR